MGLLTLVPGRSGGTETYVRGLLGAFADGHGPEEVVAVAGERTAGMLTGLAAGAVEVRAAERWRGGDETGARLRRLALARAVPRAFAPDVPEGIDVLHYPVTVPVPGFRGPTVVTLHDLAHRDLPQLFPRAERVWRRWAYDGAARNATLTITVSEHARERIVDRLGIEPDRVVAIPHGVEPRFRPAHEGEPRPPEAAKLGRYVIYPATLFPHKNHGRLLEALARVPELQLVLAGHPVEWASDMTEVARSLGVADRLSHLGRPDEATLAAVLRHARALVFPSLYEGFGQPVIEAMASGVPVACSNAAALPEVAGDAALVFDPYDSASITEALERLATDDREHERLRTAGLTRAAGFTWAASARAHAAAYERAARLES